MPWKATVVELDEEEATELEPWVRKLKSGSATSPHDVWSWCGGTRGYPVGPAQTTARTLGAVESGVAATKADDAVWKGELTHAHASTCTELDTRAAERWIEPRIVPIGEDVS